MHVFVFPPSGFIADFLNSTIINLSCSRSCWAGALSQMHCVRGRVKIQIRWFFKYALWGLKHTNNMFSRKKLLLCYFYTINIWETKRNAWNLQEGLTEFLSRFLYSFYIILIFVSFCGRFVSCWRTNRAACLKGSSVSAWDDNPLSTCSGAVNLKNVSIDVWHCSIHAWKN